MVSHDYKSFCPVCLLLSQTFLLYASILSEWFSLCSIVLLTKIPYISKGFSLHISICVCYFFLKVDAMSLHHLFILFVLMTVGFPISKSRLISTRPSIRVRTVIGGKVAKATRTQGGHSSRSSNTTRPRALGSKITTSLIIPNSIVYSVRTLHNQVKSHWILYS